MIERAKQLSDIRAGGAPPFRLKIAFKIIRDDGAVKDGTYTELWVSQTQWRRETVLGDFRRVQIALGRKLWLVDSSTNAPQQIGDIARISDVGTMRPKAWKSRKDCEINGVVVVCLEDTPGSRGERRALCFDKDSGRLNSEISPSYAAARIRERVCLHSDYQKFGNYMVARGYECHEDKHPTFEARVVELAAEPTIDAAAFAQAEGAKESVNCLVPVKPPIPINRPEAIPPANWQGQNAVMISVVVGTDGRPYDLKVTSAPNRGFDEAALKTAREYRFKPATCDGEVVEAEIGLEIDFNHY